MEREHFGGNDNGHGVKFGDTVCLFFDEPNHSSASRKPNRPGTQEFMWPLPSPGRLAHEAEGAGQQGAGPLGKGESTLLCPVGPTPAVNFPAVSGVSNADKGWGLSPPTLPPGLTRGKQRALPALIASSDPWDLAPRHLAPSPAPR